MKDHSKKRPLGGDFMITHFKIFYLCGHSLF